MPSFGKSSLAKLNTCHPDIIKVMQEAIKHYDFTVVYGTRSVEEQQKLYKVGRKLVKGVWTTVGKTVTNLDGVNKKSKHNYSPSLAIDIAPWVDGDIPWNDIAEFKKMAQIVKNAAVTVGVNLTWGGDWEKFRDYPHFEIKGA